MFLRPCLQDGRFYPRLHRQSCQDAKKHTSPLFRLLQTPKVLLIARVPPLLHLSLAAPLETLTVQTSPYISHLFFSVAPLISSRRTRDKAFRGPLYRSMR